MSKNAKRGELKSALLAAKSGLTTIFLLSAVLNILVLGGSIYMMMLYDSVLPSQSLPTLWSLFAMVFVVYLFQGLFDVLRSRMLGDVASLMDIRLSDRFHQLVHSGSLKQVGGVGTAADPLRDFDQVRNYLISPGPPALMDLPWIILFLGLLSLLHIWLGIVTLVGALVMVGLTFLANRLSKAPAEQALTTTAERRDLADEYRQHIEMIHSMGMGRRLWQRWTGSNNRYLDAQNSLSGVAGTLGGVSRVFRMFLQSIVLTVGVLLVLDGLASPGVIFASSIIAARALAPIDQVIAHWKNLAGARASWTRLEALLRAVPASPEAWTVLPDPVRSLTVEGVVLVPPGTQRVVVQGVSFKLNAGDALGIIGVSAAGKSSLARALVNIWQPARGTMRLDGAAYGQWNAEILGQHIGYLPQSVELLSGSIAENIARFNYPIDSAAVVAAAQAAGVHDMIVALAEGYDTQLGRHAVQLSAGQRQRVALARALFADPLLVVLDEPNSNLDAVGEAALDHAIAGVKARQGIAVVIAHRPNALARCDYVLIMKNGAAEAFGPKDEVMARYLKPQTDIGTVKSTRIMADGTSADAQEQPA